MDITQPYYTRSTRMQLTLNALSLGCELGNTEGEHMSGLLAGFILCTSLSAVDGDTIKCNGQNIRIMGSGSPFVSGVDAPERGKRAKCEFERFTAEKAKQRLGQLLRQNGVRIEFSGERDKTQSKRPLVWIRLPNGSTAGQTLVNEGLAKDWRPRHKIR
jgi:endonuclease YncB( thermonuclease family)